ncbi:MAG: lipocalin-like domain-containing protein [Anaerolineae bacterium]
MRFIYVLVGLLVAAGVVIVAWTQSRAGDLEIRGRLAGLAPVAANSDRFERAYAPRPLAFPADHGPHPGFQTEWWYYTGNLADETGDRFGFQLTFFRRGLAPPSESPTRSSEWGTDQIYFAHFTVTDVEGRRFYPHERFSRGAAGVAGAGGEPLRVWLEDWSATLAADGTIRLQARGEDVRLDLRLSQSKPPVLHGERGLSPKSEAPGNASYYYSLSRLPAQGAIVTPRGEFAVSGNAWLDHEWSTSALGPDAVGWDWFGLQLEDGRELVFAQIRRADGGLEPVSGGLIVEPDGSTRYLSLDAVDVEVLDTWTSPLSQATYPARWRLRVPAENLDLTVRPLLANQELPVSFVYWEGAVAVEGEVTGYGYVELTGYFRSMQGQF